MTPKIGDMVQFACPRATHIFVTGYVSWISCNQKSLVVNYVWTAGAERKVWLTAELDTEKCVVIYQPRKEQERVATWSGEI